MSVADVCVHPDPLTIELMPGPDGLGVGDGVGVMVGGADVALGVTEGTAVSVGAAVVGSIDGSGGTVVGVWAAVGAGSSVAVGVGVKVGSVVEVGNGGGMVGAAVGSSNSPSVGWSSIS
jgi:hypothetical protein